MATPIGIRGRSVTIGTNHLHVAAVGPQQIRLQVPIMIQLNCSRIAVTRAQHRKFRVIAVESC